LPAWGNAPGWRDVFSTALKARFKPAIGRVADADPLNLNCAFSAGPHFEFVNLGLCPRLAMNRAFGANPITIMSTIRSGI
jgi:hypothetical protein